MDRDAGLANSTVRHLADLVEAQLARRPSSYVPTDQPSAAWMGDVTLEMWIDAEEVPVRIRLAGSLDQTTKVKLLSVVEELIAGGRSEFEFDTSRCVADAIGTEVYAELDRLGQSSKARFTWKGRSAMAGSFGPDE